jgi:hypothetical protein
MNTGLISALAAPFGQTSLSRFNRQQRSHHMTITIGDFVTVLHPSGEDWNGSGRVIAFEAGLFAVERDDTLDVTWHGLDELEAE